MQSRCDVDAERQRVPDANLETNTGLCRKGFRITTGGDTTVELRSGHIFRNCGAETICAPLAIGHSLRAPSSVETNFYFGPRTTARATPRLKISTYSESESSKETVRLQGV